MILTEDQKLVLDAAVQFTATGQGYLTIGGLAGTGKTTVTAEIVKTVRSISKRKIRIAFCCYTGKAASVLRSKLEALNVIEPQEYCGTIHGLIYEPIVHKQIITGWRRVPCVDADLIIVDEASMVNQVIWDDLRSYGTRIIAVGDHGQLPPIEGAFNLMENPHHRLLKIHRQAENNPIIRLSIMARNDGKIPNGYHGMGVIKTYGTNAEILDRVNNLSNTLFLSGFNRTRQSLNKAIRTKMGYNGSPKVGEKVICLKNNREKHLFNGVGGVIKKYKEEGPLYAKALIKMDTDNICDDYVFTPQFGAQTTLQEWPGIKPKDLRELFDYGYCLTVHKAQGSEADTVVLFEERSSQCDDDQWRRWLYTGVTRARRRLMIVDRQFYIRKDEQRSRNSIVQDEKQVEN